MNGHQGYSNNRHQSYQGDRPPRDPRQRNFNSRGMPSHHAMRDHLYRSLFKNTGDMMDTQRSVNAILTGKMQHFPWLQPNKDDGMYPLEQVLKALHSENMDLDYVGRNHLVEIFLRDREGGIVLGEEGMGHVSAAQVEPPETLYFGTTSFIAERASRRGIMTGSKPMVVLHTSREGALESGLHFASMKQSEAAVLEVDAAQAYEDGVDFCSSGIPGTILSGFLSHRYVTGVFDEKGGYTGYEPVED
jgi:hypothetical protein